jgi:hypothetical protein
MRLAVTALRADGFYRAKQPTSAAGWSYGLVVLVNRMAPFRAGAVAWLPPFGHGNGLDAPSWAPLADVDAQLVDELLAAFRDAGVRPPLGPDDHPGWNDPGHDDRGTR